MVASVSGDEVAVIFGITAGALVAITGAIIVWLRQRGNDD